MAQLGLQAELRAFAEEGLARERSRFAHSPWARAGEDPPVRGGLRRNLTALRDFLPRDEREVLREGDVHLYLQRWHASSFTVGPLEEIAVPGDATLVEFKDAILAEKHRFAEAFAGHLLSFALARELGPADHVAIEKVANAAAADDYRIQTLLKQLVLSKPFLSKTNPKTSQTRTVKSQR